MSFSTTFWSSKEQLHVHPDALWGSGASGLVNLNPEMVSTLKTWAPLSLTGRGVRAAPVQASYRHLSQELTLSCPH